LNETEEESYTDRVRKRDFNSPMGRSLKDINEMLKVTPKTVEFHRNSLRAKLGLKH
jgi:FixJ family two-component response regulator